MPSETFGPPYSTHMTYLGREKFLLCLTIKGYTKEKERDALYPLRGGERGNVLLAGTGRLIRSLVLRAKNPDCSYTTHTHIPPKEGSV